MLPMDVAKLFGPVPAIERLRWPVGMTEEERDKTNQRMHAQFRAGRDMPVETQLSLCGDHAIVESVIDVVSSLIVKGPAPSYKCTIRVNALDLWTFDA
jgi:hypothetical protein